MVGRCGKLAAICTLSALFILSPTAVFAQDDEGLSFGEEEAAAAQDGDLSFGEEDASGSVEEEGSSPLEAGDNKSGSLAVVAVKTDVLDADQRQKLQDALDDAMKQVKGFDIQGSSGVLAEITDRGAECVREAICLASVGRNASVDKLLLARVSKIGETYKLDVDFYDVNGRLFINYETVENLGSPSAAIDNVEGAVKRLFGIKDLEDGPEVEDKPKNEWIQPTLAYTSAGLAVACFAGGAVFGNQAKTSYDDIVARSESGQLSQRQAREEYNSANLVARRANLFYGLGAGLGVLSAVLFTVDLGSDVAEDDEYVRVKKIHVAPVVTANGGSIGTFFRF